MWNSTQSRDVGWASPTTFRCWWAVPTLLANNGLDHKYLRFSSMFTTVSL